MACHRHSETLHRCTHRHRSRRPRRCWQEMANLPVSDVIVVVVGCRHRRLSSVVVSCRRLSSVVVSCRRLSSVVVIVGCRWSSVVVSRRLSSVVVGCRQSSVVVKKCLCCPCTLCIAFLIIEVQHFGLHRSIKTKQTQTQVTH